MKCATHPNIETNLSCGKCGKPICPRCMVMTPVGARCRDCAGLRRLPTYQVTPIFYLRAAGAGLGGAVAVGYAWFLILQIAFTNFLGIFIAAGAGYGIAWIISIAVNRKRGAGLAVIGAASFLLSYLVQLLLGYGPGILPVLFGHLFSIFRVLALAAGIFVAVTRLK